MNRTVIIDCFPESAEFYRSGYAIVAVDVIRATTMAITAVVLGRRCFPVTSVEEAHKAARKLENPILAGELGGDMPDGFDMSNSPAELMLRSDTYRPVILLSSSGTQLIDRARSADAVYLSCFRNFSATAQYLCSRHNKVAIIGAGSRGEFREEDQMGCAWVAQGLLDAGFRAENRNTLDIVARWRKAPPSACAYGNSARYLRRSGQSRDLDFTLKRIDDLNQAFVLQGDEIVAAPYQESIVKLPGIATAGCSEVYDAS